MTPRKWLIAAAGALTLGFSAASLQAAPVSGAASEMRNAASESGAVEPIRDYYRYGHRRHHHYHYGHRRHYYYYGYGHRHHHRHRHHHHRHW
jgi:hypothetical protein